MDRHQDVLDDVLDVRRLESPHPVADHRACDGGDLVQEVGIGGLVAGLGEDHETSQFRTGGVLGTIAVSDWIRSGLDGRARPRVPPALPLSLLRNADAARNVEPARSAFSKPRRPISWSVRNLSSDASVPTPAAEAGVVKK